MLLNRRRENRLLKRLNCKGASSSCEGKFVKIRVSFRFSHGLFVCLFYGVLGPRASVSGSPEASKDDGCGSATRGAESASTSSGLYMTVVS